MPLLWHNLHHFGDAYWKTLVEGIIFSGTFTLQGDVIIAAAPVVVDLTMDDDAIIQDVTSPNDQSQVSDNCSTLHPMAAAVTEVSVCININLYQSADSKAQLLISNQHRVMTAACNGSCNYWNINFYQRPVFPAKNPVALPT